MRGIFRGILILSALLSIAVFSAITAVNAQDVCIACHSTSSPSIVEDWNKTS